ncbi:Pro-Pol polyprotein [Dictyocoela muelleri]|nr:Pro-Pol polyprotein [Dictyocoela muelleri]
MRIYAEHNQGFKYIFTFIDSFTKFGWAYISKTKDADSFSKILLKHFYTEGLWGIFHSDNGTEFVNTKVNEILTRFNVSSVHGMPYHPQSQGQVEGFNRTIKERLRKSMPIGSFNWIDYLDNVVFYYNNTKHTATQCTPFILFKGFDMRPGFSSNNIVNSIEDVRLRIIKYTDTYRREYNLRQYDNIGIGSIVLVSKPYNVNKVRINHTFDSLYYDNHYYVRGIDGENFTIQDSVSGEIKIINRRFLKLFQGGDN